MNAGNEIDEPRGHGKGDNDLVTLPDRSTERSYQLKGTSLKHLLTCAERTGMTQIRTLKM
jgi:hypothetical protein